MKKLLVLALSSNQKLLEDAYEGLVFQREALIQEIGLEDISVLRGDLDFCLEELRKDRDHPAIVIAETVVYADNAKYNGLLQAGATEVYHFGQGSAATRLEQRFRDCVLDFLANVS